MSIATQSLLFNTTPKNSNASTIAEQPMRTIVFSSQKGGSGKTTLCGQLAIQAELAGKGPVALIDTDPQGSLSDWWNARTADSPMFVQTDVECLADTLAELRASGVKLVFIDTKPTVTDVIRDIVTCADLVVIPTRPSPHDLRAVGPTLDLVERCGKPLVFAVNCATRRARITGDAAVALSQHGTVAPVIVHNRIDFATSMVDGRSVMELKPQGPSAKEIGALWDYLEGRLARIEPPRAEALFGPAAVAPAVLKDIADAAQGDVENEEMADDIPVIVSERSAPACFGRRPIATHAGA